MIFDESGSGSLAIDGEAVAGVLCRCIFVCGANERDDEVLDRVEELVFVSNQLCVFCFCSLFLHR